MVPGKLELLSRWMAEQPWYLGKNGPPALTKAGGFRLDDPIGEVGIEFMFVTDASEQETNIYHVPLSYRGAPLKGAGVGLLGTAEHGVLGRRWIYDGAHDPVVVAGLLALAQGAAEPQHQNLSDTPDPSVAGRSSGAVRLTASGSPPSAPLGRQPNEHRPCRRRPKRASPIGGTGHGCRSTSHRDSGVFAHPTGEAQQSHAVLQSECWARGIGPVTKYECDGTQP